MAAANGGRSRAEPDHELVEAGPRVLAHSVSDFEHPSLHAGSRPLAPSFCRGDGSTLVPEASLAGLPACIIRCREIAFPL